MCYARRHSTNVCPGNRVRYSQYLSDHFLKQIRYWGIHPSFGFVEEPETNGVAERWPRTLKEQAIHGRIFQNLEAVRVRRPARASGQPYSSPAVRFERSPTG